MRGGSRALLAGAILCGAAACRAARRPICSPRSTAPISALPNARRWPSAPPPPRAAAGEARLIGVAAAPTPAPPPPRNVRTRLARRGTQGASEPRLRPCRSGAGARREARIAHPPALGLRDRTVRPKRGRGGARRGGQETRWRWSTCRRPTTGGLSSSHIAAGADGTYSPFFDYAMARLDPEIARGDAGKSALLADPPSLKPDLLPCGNRPPAVLIDLDPAGGLLPLAGSAPCRSRRWPRNWRNCASKWRHGELDHRPHARRRGQGPRHAARHRARSRRHRPADRQPLRRREQAGPPPGAGRDAMPARHCRRQAAPISTNSTISCSSPSWPPRSNSWSAMAGSSPRRRSIEERCRSPAFPARC